MTTKVSVHGYDLGIKGQGQILLVCYSFECSYWAQWLPMVCSLQRRFQITDTTLESKVNSKDQYGYVAFAFVYFFFHVYSLNAWNHRLFLYSAQKLCIFCCLYKILFAEIFYLDTHLFKNCVYCYFLTYLSRRLWGELLVNQLLSILGLSARQPFQTLSPLKLLGQFNSQSYVH